MYGSFLIAIHGYLLHAASKDRSTVFGNLIFGPDVTCRDPVCILCRHIQIFLNKRADRLQGLRRDRAWRGESGPWVIRDVPGVKVW